MQILTPDDAALDHASALLHQGRLVAFPTETVYGLGADARQGEAVAAIYAAKDRPTFNPLIVHLPDARAADRYARMPPIGRRLAKRFWPGALTLIVPLQPDSPLSELVTAGLPSVAVRVPAHPVARALLARFGGPVAAPSANPSGRISPTTAAHVQNGLGDRVDMILDGGACPLGLESTILDITGPTPRLLREGGLPAETLAQALGTPLPSAAATAPGRVTAPGQLSSHYAPRGLVRLNAQAAEPGEVLLGFGPAPEAALNLSEAGDLTEAAANLFAMLHQLDQRGAEAIAVSPIPETGLGRAINDRLRRAAAPRAGT